MRIFLQVIFSIFSFLFLLETLTAQAPAIISFTPATAPGGTAISIAGTNLTGATAVSFGAVPVASFTVTTSTSMTAIVGAGAIGVLSVTTPGGTATFARRCYRIL